VKVTITWRGNGRVGIQIFNFFWASFYFFQNPNSSHQRMSNAWTCYTLAWLKRVVTRLIDPYIALVFSPSPTFVSINVTLTNWGCLLVLTCRLAHVSFEKASTTLVMCLYLFIWVQMYVLEDQFLKCSLPFSMDPFFVNEMWVGLSIRTICSTFLILPSFSYPSIFIL